MNNINKCRLYNCKKDFFLNIKNINYCKNHTILYFNKYILIIQKYFKGFLCRKKLKNLFYNLPDDIQKKVLYFINKSIYQKRYYNKIKNIIEKKIITIENESKKSYTKLETISNLYYLINKYRIILEINNLKYLYVYGEELIHYLNNYVLNELQGNNISNSINLLYNLNMENEKIENIIYTISQIYEFTNNYNNEVNIIKVSF